MKNPIPVTVALAGNPNVGKSTVFNALTGLHQHTGNWPGKTVDNAFGRFSCYERLCTLADLPGTYSLMPHSAEEEAARDFLCFGQPDAVIVVCDATCLERNLNLVLQILEITSRVVVCLNLIDEADKKQIVIDEKILSERLGCPVVKTAARKKKSLSGLLPALMQVLDTPPSASFPVVYREEIETAVSLLEPCVARLNTSLLPSRFLCLKLLEQEEAMLRGLSALLGRNLLEEEAVRNAYHAAWGVLSEAGISAQSLSDMLAAGPVHTAENICHAAVTCGRKDYHKLDRRLDRIFTGRLLGYPAMLLLLALIFWITITGANIPSSLLSAAFSALEVQLVRLFDFLHAPPFLYTLLIQGMYRVLSWVVAVMLPPMAIFFPLFTLLEDAGYLPRIAFNLDKPFHKCHACGKQSLTMCMGFGCNAVGVTGCRIIDSKRERLIAVLTNTFVPCNGRFPTLIALITLFFIGTKKTLQNSILSALFLSAVILFGIAMTFLVSFLLSKTLLKGMPSSFTLELPPYRRPQIGKVLLRSLLDRTLFVLGRAVMVAAPAGLLLAVLAGIQVQGNSLLNHCALFLDPFARLIGMDGVILLAFILGFPANEIVIPIIMMIYLSQNAITEYESLEQLGQLLTANGWTSVTAVCTILFSLFHWPCSTTLLTIKKETGSIKWTLFAAFLPTAIGLLLCFFISALAGAAGF